MSNVVGERFQITIDKEVRERLGIRPGDRAVERVEDGRMVVEFMPKPHRRSLLGILRQPGALPITDWHAVKEAAWDLRVSEILDALDADTRRHADDR